MKLALSALLAVLALSQTVEAKTKAVVTDAKAATAEKSRPVLDNKATGGITASSGAMAAPAGKDVSSPYPPAIYFNF
ncbi:MAG: hypothetical protein EOS20_01560 [Mesorhizobium sp.]|uniref:hypothetical protein n=1 Tax=unclassified Mesorhizobium TaxID=325217 RepID=UPI000FD24AAA|nr:MULTISPECIES: hypothetical protein [unclassified Mesorhizobium]RVB77492.1 hypothetical protein EN885_12130 [Mesorhizobium sp. M6A.T.Cr.TU.014.01.1.1]RWP71710.1 MAG: hypothetical protein EOR10_29125 [Mesorhizobium sp.]RWQ01977.1 MAG: hypothetical protein EOR90_20375 [Mesorhizobium sp.]RWQ03027.1 MAG: hypothetical protein EOR91_20340 [Mesorhizobium sp.]RWQ40756.1 MAG: hypothetical protein EOS20_01560 [Mesorhizobium sp.]